ncbi:MAG: hypothetical protein EON48_10745, partial [Acetobacteraceae bacterium]
MPWVALMLAAIPQAATPAVPPQSPPEAPGDPTPRATEDPVPFLLEDGVVVGRRGSTDLTPEREFGPDDIDVLGAYDIGEVIRRLRDNLALDTY